MSCKPPTNPVKPIPKHFHFVFGLKEQTEPFHIVYYLCLKSCLEINKPDRISFYYHYEPHGEWWDKIKPELNLVKVDLESFIVNNKQYDTHWEGQYIKQQQLSYAHQADFIRLKVLLEQGGVYADMDTLFARPMPDSFYQHEFAIGTEGIFDDENGNPRQSLCNALMLAQPNAPFVKTWLERMYHSFDGSWNNHSCAEAARLALEHPEQVTVFPEEYFYKYSFTPIDLNRLFKRQILDFKDTYSIHLWSHLWWDEKRRDFTDFHAGLLTEEAILKGNTTYTALAQTFL